MPDKKDVEYQRFWAEYQSVGALIERGLMLPALERLSALRSHPRRLTFDPNRNIDYSYAVLLQQASINPADWRTSADILESMLKDTQLGHLQGDAILMRIELASALILLRDFESAARVATEAVEQSESGHRSRALAFQNLGHAFSELGRFDEAAGTYLRMIDVSLHEGSLVFAGIGAEGLARIALRSSKPDEAATWHDIAHDAYQAEAPYHLRTLADVTRIVRPDAPRASLDVLPTQARALRMRLPEPSEVGDRAGIHLDALNVDLGILHLLADIPPDEGCWTAIPLLTKDRQLCQRFSDLIIAETGAVLPHAWALPVIEGLLRELWPDKADAILGWLQAEDEGEWRLKASSSANVPFELVWRARAAWPVFFGAELRALAILLQAAFHSRQKTLSKMEGIMPSGRMDFVNLSDRAWPRPIQTWMITQGQTAAGGEIGPSQLAEDATRRRLLHEAENRRGFAEINYTPDEALKLHQGGLVALFATELMIPGGAPPRHIGTTPMNEVNIANLPNNMDFEPDMSRPGFVLDREYNTWFFAPSASQPDQGWYGAKSELFRDHFAPFHAQVEIVGSLRAKHFAIPIIDVHSPAELEHVRGLLDQAAERLKPTKHVPEDAQVWYRGQTRGYLINRPEMVNRFLFGRAAVDEPSLPGAAPRRGWNYMKVHSFLSVMLQALIYRQAAARGEAVEETHERWYEFASNPGAWDLGVMLLAQHYGVPTHGIDITNELDVALWFATNRYTPSTDGTTTYRRLPPEAWGEKPSEWPLIYAILPVTHSLDNAIRDVDLLEPLGIDALRPRRQHAAFFMGAHGLHRNRLAEALVCVMRLAPGNWETNCSYAELFPSEHEDSAYAWILDLKSRYTTGEIGKFLNEVPRYVL